MIKKVKYYYNRLLPVFKSLAIRKKILPGHKNYQKFLLLGTARVGSTLIQSYLNEHPDIYCEGEIYNTDHLKVYGKADKLLLQMKKDPLKFLNTYGYPLHSKKIKFAGFKLFYSHFQTNETNVVWDSLKNDKSIKVIHIKRKNNLRSFVSLKIATKTNKWRSFSEDEAVDEKRIALSKDECIKEFEHQEQIISKMNSLFNEHPVLDVYYKDLINDRQTIMNAVFDFLDTKRIDLPETILKKQNPESLSELIINYDRLKEDFKDTKWSIYFED